MTCLVLHIGRSADPVEIAFVEQDIMRCYALMGLDEGLEAALADDVAIEGRGTDDKRRFLELVQREGLRAALAWRESRFAS